MAGAAVGQPSGGAVKKVVVVAVKGVEMLIHVERLVDEGYTVKAVAPGYWHVPDPKTGRGGGFCELGHTYILEKSA